MADGPGFHIWEETHDEALRSASELAGSISPGQVRALHRRASASAGPDEGTEEGA